MEWVISKDWIKNHLKWMYEVYEKIFVLNPKINDLEAQEEGYNQERMRTDLWEIKEAIEDNEYPSSILTKFEKCETEIFRLYDALKTINREKLNSRKPSYDDDAKVTKELFGSELRNQSYCEKNAIEVVDIENKQRLMI